MCGCWADFLVYVCLRLFAFGLYLVRCSLVVGFVGRKLAMFWFLVLELRFLKIGG